MEHAVSNTLLVLTLLQLCRAEISQILPGTWFSANAINEDFSPKPISELFSSTSTPLIQQSAVTPSTPQYTVSQSPQFTVTQSPPSIAVKQSQPTFSVTQPIVVLSPSPSPQSTFSSISQSPGTTLTESFSTSNIPTFSSTPLSTFYSPSTTQTPTYFDIGPTFTQPTVRIVPPSSTQNPTFASEFSTTPSTAQPNFVVIYQGPQNGQPVTAASPTVPSSSISRVSSTISSNLPSTTIAPTVISSTASTPFTSPVNICRTSPIVPSTTLLSTIAPAVLPNRLLSTRSPGLLIRVVAPKGSITNVKINPSTTTRTPRTKRTQRPRKNSHEACVQSCRGRKDNLCSIPLSSTIIDQNDLKSFPSICHMACHNSYRTPAYEKISDGRCSKLRTRIITVGGTTKLRRDELKKSEYSYVNAGQQSHVVEFTNGSI